MASPKPLLEKSTMQNLLAPFSKPKAEARPGAHPERAAPAARGRRHDADMVRRAARILTLSAGCFAVGAWAQGVMPDRTRTSPTTQAFVRADLDKDGKLSKDEAARLPAIAEKFAALDRNGDGFLDAEEFAAGYESKG
jgi:hypothetical protein